MKFKNKILRCALLMHIDANEHVWKREAPIREQQKILTTTLLVGYSELRRKAQSKAFYDRIMQGYHADKKRGISMIGT